MKSLFLVIITLIFAFSCSVVYAQSLTIEAYVVYEDGQESTKNLLSSDPLSDDNAMLYNIDAGQTNPDDIEGATSKELKVVIYGEGNVDITIKKGKKTAISKKNVSLTEEQVYYIKDIMCIPIQVTIKKGKKIIGLKTVDFQCGE